MNISRLSLFVSATVTAFAAVPINATIVMVDPATLSSEAVLFADGTQTANTVFGFTALTDTAVSFTGAGGTVLRVVPADGQTTGALYMPTVKRTAALNFPSLSFGLVGGGTFDDLSFDLFGGPATSVTFSIVDDRGTIVTFGDLALGIGSNPFGFQAIAGRSIASVSFVTDSTGIDYLQNVDLKPVFVGDGSGSNVPEPATWALMLGGFVAVGGSARRCRTSSAGFADRRSGPPTVIYRVKATT